MSSMRQNRVFKGVPKRSKSYKESMCSRGLSNFYASKYSMKNLRAILDVVVVIAATMAVAWILLSLADPLAGWLVNTFVRE